MRSSNMASYERSGRADRDLTEIYRYSFEEFGEAKADAYLLALDDCLTRLASSPEIGRSAHRLRPGDFRFEQASHVVFYVKAENGIRIVRILHARMDPDRHL